MKDLLKETEDLLIGIDKADDEDFGWWDTSTGAEFGRMTLEKIRRLFDEKDNS